VLQPRLFIGRRERGGTGNDLLLAVPQPPENRRFLFSRFNFRNLTKILRRKSKRGNDLKIFQKLLLQLAGYVI
jgi:hypothetical protein